MRQSGNSQSRPPWSGGCPLVLFATGPCRGSSSCGPPWSTGGQFRNGKPPACCERCSWRKVDSDRTTRSSKVSPAIATIPIGSQHQTFCFLRWHSVHEMTSRLRFLGGGRVGAASCVLPSASKGGPGNWSAIPRQGATPNLVKLSARALKLFNCWVLGLRPQSARWTSKMTIVGARVAATAPNAWWGCGCPHINLAAPTGKERAPGSTSRGAVFVNSEVNSEYMDAAL